VTLENFRLKVFRAVAKHLSFRKAAEALLLTQPAVTLQIKALEDSLGVRLFDRSSNRVALTSEGHVLLRYSEKIAALASEAEQRLASSKGELAGPLSIGVSTTIVQYVFAPLIKGFTAQHPRVQLSVLSGNTDEIVQSLISEKVSIGLIEGPARHRHICIEPFMEDELVLIAPAGFEFDRLSRNQLLATNLIMREQGSGSRHVVEVALEKAGYRLKSLRIVMDLDSTEAIKSSVEAGIGVSFVSRWAIANEIELGLLKIVPVEGLRIVRNFSIIYRVGPFPTGPAGAFRAYALEYSPVISPTSAKTARPRGTARSHKFR
jgi:LysR family transcriptional regulator, transcriptional activator of the cysJI operon